MKKSFILVLLSTFMIFGAVAPTTVKAQEGGGVDICTYYNANGFTSKRACDHWLLYNQQLHQPKWQKKLGSCLISQGITVSPSLVYKQLAMSPAAFAATYGTAVIGCMFG